MEQKEKTQNFIQLQPEEIRSRNDIFCKIWEKKIQVAIEKCTKLADDRFFEADCSYINFIYDECKSIVAPIAKLIDKYIDTKSTKNEEFASKCRLLGNQSFISEELDSIKLYTAAILHAPVDSEELSLAFGNRSAAFFKIRQYENCISDIRASLESNYPDIKKCKLLLRLVQSNLRLKRKQDGLQALQLLKSDPLYVDFIESEINLKSVSDVENKLQSLLDDCQIDKTICKVIPEPKSGYHKTINHASMCLEVKESSEKGRYIVANRDLEPADVLFVEPPFCSRSTYKDIFCDEIQDKSNLTSPCPNCTNQFYATKAEREEAWKMYHQWECNGLTEVLLENIGIAGLGFRVMLKGACVTSEGGDSYKPIEQLVTNLDKMHSSSGITYSLIAVLLVYYLKLKTSFFEWYSSTFDIPQTKLSRQLSLVLLRHICQIQCNAHANDETLNGKVKLTCGIYPSISLMNHSCDPNIYQSFIGSTLVIHAARLIKEGEEVFNSYGHNYRYESRESRQDNLALEYYFDCNCVPCTSEEFKLYYELKHALICPDCDGKLIEMSNKNYVCISCKFLLPRDSEMIQLYREVCKLEIIDKGDCDFKIKFYENVIKFIHPDNLSLLNLYSKILFAYLEKLDFCNAQVMVNKCKDLVVSEFGDNHHLVGKKLKLIVDFNFDTLLSEHEEFQNFLQFFNNYKEDVKQRLRKFYSESEEPWV